MNENLENYLKKEVYKNINNKISKKFIDVGLEKILACINCGTCTGSCPSGRRTAFRTRSAIRKVLAGDDSILKDIETSDLTDEELLRCYEGAWSLSIKILQNFKEINTKEFKSAEREKIFEKRNYIGELMDGVLTPYKYADVMAKEIAPSIE